ncbi:hypothetical protein M408DRAFT_331386 [Serendipita vermifera MAFF 305830]|uniref:J domain-containing protein n=1 Tax=Serendipita vermifera MAFF 305830 TaxID=933852 RepID=A0A0C2X724_SERVB|nr:hypothetical protein M408DRAFT_331386 [Serendipita vermifera MAFF 305830]
MHRLRLIAQPSTSTRSVFFIGKRMLHVSPQSCKRTQDTAPLYQLHARWPKANCPSCNAPLTTSLPTCNNCGYIAPLPSSSKVDYFALFGLPTVKTNENISETEDITRNAFNVDPKELRRRFLQLQKLCHPDRWAQKSPEAAEAAAGQSALLNKAYQTLLSPRKRGEYILSQHGVDILEADNMDEEQDLMLQVMEAREELEEAEGEEVKELLEVNRERIEKATMELENAIAYEDWEEAKRAVIRLRYWESFQRAGTQQDVDH